MKKKVFIEGMSCGHCVARVEKALNAFEGVSNVEVDLDGKNAKFDTTNYIDNQKIIDAIDDAGYDVVKID